MKKNKTYLAISIWFGIAAAFALVTKAFPDAQLRTLLRGAGDCSFVAGCAFLIAFFFLAMRNSSVFLFFRYGFHLLMSFSSKPNELEKAYESEEAKAYREKRKRKSLSEFAAQCKKNAKENPRNILLIGCVSLCVSAVLAVLTMLLH